MATYRPPPPRRKSSYANTSALPFYPEQFDADQKYYLGKFLDYHLGGRKPDRVQTKVYFPLSGFGERSVDSPTHVFGGQVSGQNLSLAPPMPKPMGFAGAAQQRVDAGQQPPMAPLSMAPPAMPMGFAGALPPSAGVNQMSEVEQIKEDEGFVSHAYLDSMGKSTIGYGFNLEKPGSESALVGAGIEKSLADLINGESFLTPEEASRLMMSELGSYEDSAKRFVGKETWENLSENRRGILLNMAYNMGEATLSEFKKLKAAIKQGDWKEAQIQMRDSRWSRQVKKRADRLIARMGQDDI